MTASKSWPRERMQEQGLAAPLMMVIYASPSVGRSVDFTEHPDVEIHCDASLDGMIDGDVRECRRDRLNNRA